MFMYVGVAIVDHHHIPPYLMPAESAYRLKLAWAVTVFIITIFFLQLFAYLASGVQKQLAEEAMHDKLTCLYNRYYMNDFLERAVKSSGSWLAIVDIDDFKQVNDIYGHNCGDYVLKTMADLLRRCEAEVCRWGGEEFLLVGENAGPGWLDDFRRQVEEFEFLYEGQKLHLTITIGVAAGRPDDSMETWVNRADMKLYEGKTTGKNKVVA
jgi:diguanylate cyclase (GGDEF)-like protein